MSGPGQTISNGALAISGPDYKVLDQGYTLTTAGSVTWGGAGTLYVYRGSAISNSGAWTLNADETLVNNILGPLGSFTNTSTGTFTKAAGPGTTPLQIAFNNAGTVTVNSGKLQLAGGGFSTGTFDVAAGAYLQFTSGTHTLTGSAIITDTGKVEVQNNAAVVVDTTLSVQNFGLYSGSLRLTSRGILNVSGTYDQTTSGALVVEIGGTTAGAGYGQLNVTGTANLAGSFKAELVNDFAPSIGDSYAVITWGSLNGAFNNVFLPGLPPDRRWDTSNEYSATGFTLTVIAR
jgi:hypothetical protein